MSSSGYRRPTLSFFEYSQPEPVPEKKQASRMAQLRTSVYDTAQRTVQFHLREVGFYKTTCPWKSELWLFGNTSDHVSVAIKVLKFQPYIYVERPKYAPDFFASKLKAALPAVFTRLEYVDLVPLVGFFNNIPRPLCKIYYSDPCQLTQLLSHFQNTDFQTEQDRSKLEVYHENWAPEALFLHTSGLKLQQWTRVHLKRVVKTQQTVCQLEAEHYWNHWAISILS